MLRRTRLFVIVFFLISLLIFAGYQIIAMTTVDRTIPVIDMESESVNVSVTEGDEAILRGVTATDEKDGDITKNLFIESKSQFTEKGRFNVTIAVSDKDNHVAKTTREVIYSDYISPQFSLSSPLKFLIKAQSRDDLNIASGLKATDAVDGNISNKIRISSDYSILSNTSGDYPMEFIVTNSMGDTSKLPVTVTIYNAVDESGLPQITLSTYLVNTPASTAVDIAGLIERITFHNSTYRRGDDGNFYNGEYDAEGNPVMFSADTVEIQSDVDWDVPGVYEVKISFTDPQSELSNSTRCYMVVY